MENNKSQQLFPEEEEEEEEEIQIDNDAIVNGMIQVSNKVWQETIRNIYIVFSILIIYFSLLLFKKWHLLSCTLIMAAIFLLQFKRFILSFIYETLNI